MSTVVESRVYGFEQMSKDGLLDKVMKAKYGIFMAAKSLFAFKWSFKEDTRTGNTGVWVTVMGTDGKLQKSICYTPEYFCDRFGKFLESARMATFTKTGALYVDRSEGLRRSINFLAKSESEVFGEAPKKAWLEKQLSKVSTFSL